MSPFRCAAELSHHFRVRTLASAGFQMSKATRALPVFIVTAGLGVACALFAWGLRLPLHRRVAGDAREYLWIASQFEDLHGMLAYVGDRAVGFPLLAFGVREILGVFIGPPSPLAWANAICIFIFALHLLASVAAVSLATKYRLIESRVARSGLFALLVSFPAFVGHTTTPLTDTCSAGVVLLAIWMSDRALSRREGTIALIDAVVAGTLWALSALIRPGYVLPMWSALLVLAVLALRIDRRAFVVALGILISASAMVAPFAFRCQQRFGELCLQNPNSFEIGRHARMGMKGARLLWFHRNWVFDEFPIVPDEFPILPDQFMFENFYTQCRPERFVGIADDSVTGCMLRRPHLVPAYLAKKWIGLHDHFRFQPYAEPATPVWLRRLSRSYDACAWIGFVFAWFWLFVWLRQRLQARAFPWQASLGIAACVFFSLMLAEHTFLHAEDRFSLSWMALCCASFVRLVETISARFVQRRWSQVEAYLAVAAIVLIVFALQIAAWDRVQF
jgi:hypothetical protein